MKVLVTGGCGLIGFHAARFYKERGHEVEVIDNLERSQLLGHEVNFERKFFNQDLLVEMGVNVYPLDVSEKFSFQCLKGHDVIIHMAAQCGVPTSIANPRRDYEVNLQGTFNMLEYARKHNSTVVFASTNKVYPIHEGFVKIDNRWQFENPEFAKNGFPVKDDLVGARTPYGWSKYAGDLLCQEYAHTYGVRTGVFRMSCIYGPNQILGFEEQGWAVWMVIATLKDWPITIYGDGCQVRDMLYVEDTIKAYDAFVKSDYTHGVYNLGGGPNNTISLNEHLDYLYSATGKRSSVIYSDWRPLDQKCYISDISKIKKDLNWKPIITINDGTEKVISFTKKHIGMF